MASAMDKPLKGEVLLAGQAGQARALVLDAPISFWGGVNPQSGEIIDQRHPQCGERMGGRVLCLPGTIGSSGASSVLLELVHRGSAPAAIILDHPDTILLLGLIAAREMAWPHPVAIKLPKKHYAALKGRIVAISSTGEVTILDPE